MKTNMFLAIALLSLSAGSLNAAAAATVVPTVVPVVAPAAIPPVTPGFFTSVSNGITGAVNVVLNEAKYLSAEPVWAFITGSIEAHKRTLIIAAALVAYKAAQCHFGAKCTSTKKRNS